MENTEYSKAWEEGEKPQDPLVDAVKTAAAKVAAPVTRMAGSEPSEDPYVQAHQELDEQDAAEDEPVDEEDKDEDESAQDKADGAADAADQAEEDAEKAAEDKKKAATK